MKDSKFRICGVSFVRIDGTLLHYSSVISSSKKCSRFYTNLLQYKQVTSVVYLLSFDLINKHHQIIWCWGSSFGVLGCMKHFFVAIIPRSTLTIFQYGLASGGCYLDVCLVQGGGFSLGRSEFIAWFLRSLNLGNTEETNHFLKKITHS